MQASGRGLQVATASAMLSLDEREMGVGLLDIGAGTCDMALYHGGPLRHLAEVPFGGQDITRDLSMVLNISPREAEQLKCDHGGVCTSDDEAAETITFRTTAGRSHTILREQLDAIIEARQQEVFEAIAAGPRGSVWLRLSSAPSARSETRGSTRSCRTSSSR